MNRATASHTDRARRLHAHHHVRRHARPAHRHGHRLRSVDRTHSAVRRRRSERRGQCSSRPRGRYRRDHDRGLQPAWLAIQAVAAAGHSYPSGGCVYGLRECRGPDCVDAELSRSGVKAAPAAPLARRQRRAQPFGRPARRTPGHTGRGPQTKMASTAHRLVAVQPAFLGARVSNSWRPRQWRSLRSRRTRSVRRPLTRPSLARDRRLSRKDGRRVGRGATVGEAGESK